MMRVNNYKKVVLFITIALLFFACSNSSEKSQTVKFEPEVPVYCVSADQLRGKKFLNEKFLQAIEAIETSQKKANSLDGMVFIPGGIFEMGADQPEGFDESPSTALAQPDEFPKHTVKLNDFYMDEHEVTVGEFMEFVQATNYKTVAEYDMDWEELKKQLPPGTPKPDEEMLKAGALVFHLIAKNSGNAHQANWWKFVKGAHWKNPDGKNPDLKNLLDHPVTQISWYDAMAYAKWVGKRLPTEAEFEYAMRGGNSHNMYPWGNERVTSGNKKGNFFEGEFPYINIAADNYESTAPVKSFPPNAYGLYDMAGNVWEWTSDWYSPFYYQQLKNKKEVSLNPLGPEKTIEIHQPNAVNKVVRGGSFLCHDSYCSGFRNARRMRLSPDSGMEHVGFRLVRDK